MKEIIALYRELHPLIETVFDFLESRPGRLVLTLLLLMLATLINRITYWRLSRQKNKAPQESTRATWVRRRNMVWVSTVLLILALWSNQITGFMISIAALAGALLVVSKEFILCLWGAVVISLNKSLKIGSTIEIGRHTGQLVNTGFFSFELAEIGPSKKQTGRLLQIPNSQIFLETLKNLSSYGPYGVHLIDFNFDKTVNLDVAETLVLELANEAGKEWIDQAEKHFSALERSYFVDLPKAQPEVFWTSVDEKCLRMTLRLACPLSKRGRIEKNVVKAFWSQYPKQAQTDSSSEKI